jgi:radical SAM superfamily enzyme YgiQ (UPF0313 family)
LDIKNVSIFLPWSLLYLASSLRKNGYNVKIIDQRTESNWKKTLLNALKQDPLFVGISSMTGKQILYALHISKFVKENSPTPVVRGGIHASLLPQQTIKNKSIDIILRKEGDLTAVELAKALEKNRSLKDIKGICYKKDNKIILTPEREFIAMDRLIENFPFDLINMKDYFLSYVEDCKRMLTVFTTRGCSYKCMFCYNASYNKSKWRALSAEKTIKLFTIMVKKYNLDGLLIYDDDFFVDINRVKKICLGIIKNRLNIKWFADCRVNHILRMDKEMISLLKKSGCESLFFGIESGSERILKMIKKGFTVKDVIKCNLRLKEIEIIPGLTFMSGFPTETEQERKMTYSLIDRLMKDNSKVEINGITLYSPYPGTELFEISKQHGFKPPQKLEDWANITFSNSIAPWLKKKDRRKIERVYFISKSIDGNWMNNYTSSNPLIKIATTIFSKLARFRWRHRAFNFSPDIDLVKFAYEKGIF